MSVLSELQQLRSEAELAPESEYQRGYLDALDLCIEIAEDEEADE